MPAKSDFERESYYLYLYLYVDIFIWYFASLWDFNFIAVTIKFYLSGWDSSHHKFDNILKLTRKYVFSRKGVHFMHQFIEQIFTWTCNITSLEYSLFMFNSSSYIFKHCNIDPIWNDYSSITIGYRDLALSY